MTSYQRRKEEVRKLKAELEKAEKFEQQLKEYIIAEKSGRIARKNNVLLFIIKNSEKYRGEILRALGFSTTTDAITGLTEEIMANCYRKKHDML